MYIPWQETRTLPQGCTTVSLDCSSVFPHPLECVPIPFSRGSSQLRDWTQASCFAGRFFTTWTNRKPFLISNCLNLPVETQGRSWGWIKPITYNKKINEEHRKAFVSKSPLGSSWYRQDLSLAGHNCLSLSQCILTPLASLFFLKHTKPLSYCSSFISSVALLTIFNYLIFFFVYFYLTCFSQENINSRRAGKPVFFTVRFQS